jgi:VanZ family protein
LRRPRPMLIRLIQRLPSSLRIMAVTLWALAIPAASLLPAHFFSHTPELDCLPYADKLVHAALYGILTGLWLWRAPDPATMLRYGFIATAATAYGLLMEWLQHFTPSRSMDLTDALANALGAFLVAAVALVIVSRKKGD